MRTNTKLNRESQKAANVCKSAMTSWADASSSFTLHPTLHLGPMFQTGCIEFSKTKITVDQGETWRWNKTGSVSNYFLTPDTKISFFKLNSRSKKTGSVNPGLKIWLFTIETRYSTKPTYFVWCERGAEVTPYFETEIKLEDLSFLRQFVSDELAKELNWV